MTKRIGKVKQCITSALHEVEIYAAQDYGMSEHEYMRLLVETVNEVAANYIEINAQVINTYNPEHVQSAANGS